MARSAIDNGELTLVLVGRTGNGKSATGNSILGRRAFKSRASSSGVTSSCELQSTKLKGGQIINVIDTPGLFDFSAETEFIGKEIVKCIKLAKDGIHAVLVVLSVKTRFSREEEAAFSSLKELFGDKIIDYAIVVFTGGDELEENEETLEDYLGRDCPEPLEVILDLCKNRRVLFDNKTKDETKKGKQVGELLSLVNTVVAKNRGKPYTHDMFADLKVQSKTKETTNKLEQELAAKLKETMIEHQKQLAAEQAARLKAEQDAQAAKKKLDDEIRKLSADLEISQQEASALRARRVTLDIAQLVASALFPRQRKSTCNVL